MSPLQAREIAATNTIIRGQGLGSAAFKQHTIRRAVEDYSTRAAQIGARICDSAGVRNRSEV
jgi:hypothetical protein